MDGFGRTRDRHRMEDGGGDHSRRVSRGDHPQDRFNEQPFRHGYNEHGGGGGDRGMKRGYDNERSPQHQYPGGGGGQFGGDRNRSPPSSDG